MHLFVSPTDHDWYEFLRQKPLEEVNFWRPSAGKRFTALQPGEPFLFKAKAPHHAIIGGGRYVRYVRAPISLAWQAFGENNGTPDVISFLQRVRKYRGDDLSPDPEVGCILLSEPFFFPEELWVEPPEDWSRQIVSGKQYDTETGIGAALWDAVVERIADPRTVIGPAPGDAPAVDERTSTAGGAVWVALPDGIPPRPGHVPPWRPRRLRAAVFRHR